MSLDDIRARHREMGTFCPTMALRQVHDDRGALLVEVDRLTAALAEAKEQHSTDHARWKATTSSLKADLAEAQKQAAAWEVLAQDRGDLLQRLRGGLVALGKAWAAAGYPPLPELEWLQKETP